MKEQTWPMHAGAGGARKKHGQTYPLGAACGRKYINPAGRERHMRTEFKKYSHNPI